MQHTYGVAAVAYAVLLLRRKRSEAPAVYGKNRVVAEASVAGGLVSYHALAATLDVDTGIAVDDTAYGA